LSTVVDTNGPFRDFFPFRELRINASGTVAFLGILDDGRYGIFTGPDPIADKVIATGDALNGSTVSSIDTGISPEFNDAGQIAFKVMLADGRQVLIRADPVTNVIRWAGPSQASPDGAFNTAGNWQPQQVPIKDDTRADTALFDLDRTYDVTVENAHTVERVIVSDGVVKFTGAGSIDAASSEPDTPGLSVEGARLNVEGGGLSAVAALVNQEGGILSAFTVAVHGPAGAAAEVRIENELKILNGARVESGFGFVGGSGAANVAIEGRGARWRLDSEEASDPAVLAISGDPGDDGAVAVRGGGSISADAALAAVVVGDRPNGMGLLEVTGKDDMNQASLVSAYNLRIGNEGEGELKITAGGQVETNTARLAVMPASRGTMIVEDAGSAFTVTDLDSAAGLFIGRAGTAEVFVRDGGKIESLAVGVTLGELAGSFGSLEVDGGELLTGVLRVGSNASDSGEARGELKLLNAGKASAFDLMIGSVTNPAGAATARGDAIIRGAGSDLTILVSVAVGENGAGSLQIEDGGALVFESDAETAALRIGVGRGVGRVTVSGANSRIEDQAQDALLVMGASTPVSETSRLDVLDGATATFGRGAIARELPAPLGNIPAALIVVRNATLNFTLDAGPIDDFDDYQNAATQALFLGQHAELRVEGGGKLNSRLVILGEGGVGSTRALVSGADSTWKASEIITLPDFPVVVRVLDGATLDATKLTIAGVGIFQVANGSHLESQNANVGTTVFGVFSGNAGIDLIGEDTTWSTDTLVVGDAGPSGSGIVQISTGAVLTADIVTVNRTGRIEGNGGRLVAGQRIVNGGTIAPGLSPGVLTIEGNYEQSESGRLEVEIAGLTAQTQYDQLIVTGDVDIDGTLQLSFIDGFLPRTGDTFDFLEVGGLLTGGFSEVEIEGILPDWEYEFGQNGEVLQLRSLSDAVPILPGDFSADGTVNAADYVVWRKSGGPPGEYETWRTNFGRTAGGGDGSAASLGAHSQVPEPASFVMFLTGTLAATRIRRRFD
jgi:T5SS/PEP-CTERM-associated repeat protein